MRDRTVDGLAKALAHDPLDPQVWVDLARRSDRLGRLPDFLVPGLHLPLLCRAWLRAPAEQILLGLFLPLAGLRLPGRASPPPAWYAEQGRLGDGPEGPFDRVTGLPLEVVRADGAAMRLVPEGPYRARLGRREVRIPFDEFYLDVFPVTVELYRARRDELGMPRGWTAQEPRPLRPVVGVTPAQALAFAAAGGGDLPTEGEWEYAASAGDPTRIFPWGADAPYAHDHPPRAVVGTGYFDEDDLPEPADDRLDGLAEIGGCPGNVGPLGIRDTAGNAAQWCRHDPRLDPRFPPGGPGPRPPPGAGFTARGGSWYHPGRAAGAFERLPGLDGSRPSPLVSFRTVLRPRSFGVPAA